MTNKARSKPCRHCLFSKNHLGTEEEKHRAILSIDQGGVFYCHEHKGAVLCNGYCKRHPDRVGRNTQFTNENGELKSFYSHMKRHVMNKCQLTRSH